MRTADNLMCGLCHWLQRLEQSQHEYRKRFSSLLRSSQALITSRDLLLQYKEDVRSHELDLAQAIVDADGFLTKEKQARRSRKESEKKSRSAAINSTSLNKCSAAPGLRCNLCWFQAQTLRPHGFALQGEDHACLSRSSGRCRAVGSPCTSKRGWGHDRRCLGGHRGGGHGPDHDRWCCQHRCGRQVQAWLQVSAGLTVAYAVVVLCHEQFCSVLTAMYLDKNASWCCKGA